MIEQMLQQMNEPATAATARRRTASTGVDMKAMMRATQTISGQVCSGVCAKVSEVSRKRIFMGHADHRLAYCRWTTSWIFEFHCRGRTEGDLKIFSAPYQHCGLFVLGEYSTF